MRQSDVIKEMLDRIQSLTTELERTRQAHAHAESMRTAAETRAAHSFRSEREVTDLIAYMASDRLIEAIKAYRTLTGHGLKESKDAIESVIRKSRVA